MTILVKENRVTYFLRDFSTKARIWLSILTIFAFCLTWIFLFEYPLTQKIKGVKKELEDLEEENLHLSKELVQYKEKEKENEQIFFKLKERESFCNSAKDCTNIVLGLFRKHYLVCSKIEQERVKQKEFCSKKCINLFGHGRFGNILAFFVDLEKCTIPLKIKNVSFERWIDRKVKFSLSLNVIAEVDLSEIKA